MTRRIAGESEPERGLAAELLSIEEIVRALRRLPSERAKLRVLGAAVAHLEDRAGAKVTVEKAMWKNAFTENDQL